MSSPEQVFAGTDAFRHVLRRYIAEAPSGFAGLGAREGGGWTPTVTFADAISCRGGGPDDGPFIECVLYSSPERAEMNARFEEVTDRVQNELVEWKKSDISQFDMPRLFFANGPTMSETTASVDIAMLKLGDDYNVNLVVQSWNLTK